MRKIEENEQSNIQDQSIIERILELMKEQGLTQTKLSECSGISFGHLNRMLNGKVAIMPNSLQKIADALSVKVFELTEERENHATSIIGVSGYLECCGEVRKIRDLKALKKYVSELEQMEHYFKFRQKQLPKQKEITLEDIVFGQWETYDATIVEVRSFRHHYDIIDDRAFNVGNMCSGYPFILNGELFNNSEAAYIAGLYSNDNEEHNRIQKLLQVNNDGYRAKKEYRHKRYDHIKRQDWEAFNVEWMKFVVWQKCKSNTEFANKLKSIPKTAMVVENSTGMAGATAQFWGCFNEDLEKLRNAKEQQYKMEHPKAKKEEVNAERNRWNNYGIWEGTNTMGKIIKACSICLIKGNELPIDYELLEKKDIYLLGNRLVFPSPREVTTHNSRQMAVIFDMDDTLLNTDVLAPYIAALKKTKQGTDEQKAAWKELYEHVPECSLYDGMQEVFDYIKRHDIQVCLCSNSPLKRIKPLVKEFCVPIPDNRLISAYSCGNRFSPERKPKPAQFLKALELMNEIPENVVAFGNKDCDIIAAHNVGMLSVGCTWGNTEETNAKMLEAKPDRVINSPMDIISIINNGRG